MRNKSFLFSNEHNEKLESILKDIEATYGNSLPLCAAETPISDYARLPLTSLLQERYIMGGSNTFLNDNNFINSDRLYSLYEMFTSLSKEIFGSKYADARAFSGMNTIQLILMSLTTIGDRILISSSQSGGHSSVEKIAERLGLRIDYIPYNYHRFDYDYEKLNHLISQNEYKLILMAPSDIIYEPQLSLLKYNPEKTHFIFDASQTLGFIAAKKHSNPLNFHKESVLIGGTHKTIPGPTNGVILTNNDVVIQNIDNKINPEYIRNVNLHHIASLIKTFIEFIEFGNEYIELIQKNVCYMTKLLKSGGFEIASYDGKISETHQIFLKMTPSKTERFYKDALFYNITMNKKHKKLFNNSGIRIGLQEISRYNWQDEEIDHISHILINMKNEEHKDIENMIKNFDSKKTVHFTF